MSQSARGSAITQVSVAASKNVNISINGQLAVQLLAPVYPRPLPTENRQEIDLLKAAHAQVPFTGRQAILDDFLEWCSHERALSMRTLVGQGGAGKTRFAYELYARIRKQPGWNAYFLRFLKNEAKEADLWREIKSKNALIIADYASMEHGLWLTFCGPWRIRRLRGARFACCCWPALEAGSRAGLRASPPDAQAKM